MIEKNNFAKFYLRNVIKNTTVHFYYFFFHSVYLMINNAVHLKKKLN